MRHLILAAILLAALLPAGVSLAQDAEGGDVQTRFYDFNDMIIFKINSF